MRPGRLSAVPTPATAERALPWVLRLGWVGVLFFGWPAIDAATAGSAGAVESTARIGAGALWLVGVAAMAIPAVVSLTAVRAVVPLAVPIAIATVSSDAGLDSALFAGAAAISTVVAFSAELGRAFVQASAYGDEDRHLLRPPFAYAAMTIATWAIWVACIIAGPLLLADRSWLIGGLCSALAAVGTVWLWPRWHKLSRRWLVIMPVGVVLHDHVVLAETMMLRRSEVAALHLAPLGTEAADLTGPASGHAVEITTHEPVTVIFAASPREPRGRVVHLTGCLVSPSRPGRALAAAKARRLPVG